MAEPILCKICGVRRAKRACPAVHGDICSICCGTEREVSLSCPLECGYLREAYKHEKGVETSALFDEDVEVREEFIRSHEELMMFCMFSLMRAAQKETGAVDSDVREALAALVLTERTAQSGLLYETRPENGIAAAIQRSFSESMAGYEAERREKGHLATLSNLDLLPILVLIRRVAHTNDNGRPRGRMFLAMLNRLAPVDGVDEREPSIIL